MTSNYAALFYAAQPYLSVVAYLACVWATLYVFQRVPHWVHVVGVVAGLVARIGFGSGWVDIAVALGAGGFVFVALVGLAARTVSAVSLFSVCAALVLMPVSGWPGLLCGLFAAAVVATVRTWRAMGKDRVTWLVHDTLSGMGISTAGGFKPAQPEHIPDRDTLMGEGGSGTQMYLPPYLFGGAVVAMLVAVWPVLT